HTTHSLVYLRQSGSILNLPESQCYQGNLYDYLALLVILSDPSSTVRFTKYLNKHGNPSRAGGLALHFRWGGIRTLRRRGWSAAARRRRPAGPGWQPGAAPSE